MKKLLFWLTIFCCYFNVNAQNQEYISMNNQDFAQLIKSKKVQLIDIRTPVEYLTGHIPNAINIDMTQSNFDIRIDSLKKKIRLPYIVEAANAVK